MRIRHAVLVGASVLTAAVLSGCTVPVGGSTGISVTEDGRPVGVVAVCDDRIDGATLYVDSKKKRDDTRGTWSRKRPVTGLAMWTLDSPGKGWSTDEAMAPLEPHRTYHLYGWTRDNSSSTAHVSFTRSQLDNLRPGQVRYFAGEVAGADREGFRTVPLEDFRSEACEED
ncbi:hypothetical protein [Streptomyces fructofermentans]|uniref:Lipoprotein n=1 Tax=Streptomyces fructofermentans TaxID=152141 RepID=A0A918NCV5_9ACTN|nr:hypothetical protein [Streptomyces fructofermentans]GGX63131.1 hypothetical protein GCM10010515_33490 [Streptomyces fructofermentans]